MGYSTIRHSLVLLTLIGGSFFQNPATAADLLPDTGQVLCYDGAQMVACTQANAGDQSPHPGQDGRYGRDPASELGIPPKRGEGDGGFDYTKLCNSGEEAGQGDCPADPTPGDGLDDWGCVRDNITGLVWEVKTWAADSADKGLRDGDWRYSWYDSNPLTNGGMAGTADAGEGDGRDICFDPARCDTEKYVADVNALAIPLCGQRDWRLPTLREFLTLVHFGRFNPALDPAYFPNAKASWYWTGTTLASDDTMAWYLVTYNGRAYFYSKERGYTYHSVRLVRGGED